MLRALPCFAASLLSFCCSRSRSRHARVETYRGMTVKMELTEKVMLDIGVSEPFVEATVEAILAAARTGEVGDGKIFVLPVERVYRIRTGEEDTAAVTPVA
ncbi:MAG: P-II family nitrogen regulator [Rhodothermales bacterium]|nr:P-II family nitrogen regulator [Rhodothermales bacterium]